MTDQVISGFVLSSLENIPMWAFEVRTAGATGFQCLVSPTIAEPCRDTIDGKLDPTQHLLVDAARSVLLQELDLDVVQRIQVREPVAYRAIEQRIILQELAMIRHGEQGLDRVVMLPANAFEDRLS
jgi:hypothetical protein